MKKEASQSELKNAIREAAQWYALLLSPAVTVADQHAWQQWLQQDPHHQLAWQQVEQVQTNVTRLPGGIALPALRGAALSRRDLLRRLAVLAVVAPVGLAAWRTAPWQEWQAQYSTGIGEQKSLTLPDGGSVTLNTATAVDVQFSDSQRLLALYSGEVLVQTAADTYAPARPFVLETPHGRVQALGTRFMVRIHQQHSDVTVLEDSVRITPRHSRQSLDIATGQQLSFTADEPGSVVPAPRHAGSWLHGSLMVVDMPLRTLLAELARYRKGMLSCSDDIAQLKISGAFPLNDTDRALAAITRAFAVQERRLSRYWVRLSAV